MKKRRRRTLYFGDIALISAGKSSAGFDMWHLPGREVATTKELLRRANERDVPVRVFAPIDGVWCTVLLN